MVSWKQPKYPSMDKWMDKENVICTYEMKYYPGIKKGNPAKCDNINANMKNRSEKDKYSIIT